MRTFLNLAVGVALLGAASWVVFGNGGLPLPARIAIVVGCAMVVAAVVGLASVRGRRRRLARNQEHCAARGFVFQADASIDDVFHDAGLFRHLKVRIEQLARGKYGAADVDVFDLSYEVTSHDSDGNTNTHTVSQTVASLSDHGRAGLRFSAAPLRGLGGGLLRFLGLTSQVESSRDIPAADQALVDWCTRNYSFTWGDESSREKADGLVDSSLMQWLQHHDHLAFEIADRQLLVWAPRRVVDSTARDQLVNEALDLACRLRSRSKTDAAAVRFVRPETASVHRLMWRLAASGFGSWLIAVVVMMSGFGIAIISGVAQQAPLPTLVGLMLLTCCVWVGSGALIYRYLSRRSSRGDPQEHVRLQ